MQKLPLATFFGCLAHLSAFSHATGSTADLGQGALMLLSNDQYAKIRESAKSYIECCVQLDLKTTESAIDNVLALIDQATPTAKGDQVKFEFELLTQIRTALTGLAVALKNEAKSKSYYLLESTKANLYEPTEPLFGAKFEAQFPSCALDLTGAAQCRALGQYTPAVFHLMRIMEHGLRAVSQCLGAPAVISGSARNWGVMLVEIEKTLKARMTAGTLGSADREFIESMHTSLDSVRRAWRNPTMHIGNSYTSQEAEQIYVVVKGFMVELADRMDENGAPKA